MYYILKKINMYNMPRYLNKDLIYVLIGIQSTRCKAFTVRFIINLIITSNWLSELLHPQHLLNVSQNLKYFSIDIIYYGNVLHNISRQELSYNVSKQDSRQIFLCDLKRLYIFLLKIIFEKMVINLFLSLYFKNIQNVIQ